MRPFRPAAGPLFASLALLWACGSGDGGSGQPDITILPDADTGDGSVDAPDLTPCEDSTDCGGGEVCRDGICREACGDGDGCDADLPVCDEEAGICVGCLEDGDCDAGSICDETLRVCVEGECTSDDDCPGGFSCETGRCVSIDEVICVGGSQRCDGNTLRTCSRDGTREDGEDCGAGAVCVPQTEGSAACLPVVCEPDAVSCLDDGTAGLCDQTGTGYEELPCRPNQYCAEGVCLAQVCTPSSASCDGGVAVVCDRLGSSESVTVCADAEGCAGTALGCACVDGGCEPRICEPTASQCVGNARRECNALGTAWMPLEPCGDEALCLGGACLDVVCEAGTVECAGESVATCGEDGTTRTLEDCTASDQICVPSGVGVACGDRVCVPSSARCAEGREVVVSCDARGGSESERSCEEGQFCSMGACLEQVCVPGTGPTCRDGDAYSCDSRGASWVLVTDCTEDQICRSGGCIDVVCAPGTVGCDGELRRACNADGTVETVTDCVDEGAWCNTETQTCTPRVCSAGPPVCRAGDVQQCNARGSAWELVRDCTDVGCEAGVCLFPCGDGVLDDGEECDLGETNGVDSVCTAECLINRDVVCGGVDDALCVVLPRDGASFEVELDATLPELPIDVAWLLDLTGSNYNMIEDFTDGWSTTINPSLRAQEPDHAQALVIHEGFPCDDYAPELPPFQLRQRATTRDASMAVAIAGVSSLATGAAEWESVIEAIREIAVGDGFAYPACDELAVPGFDPSVNRIAGVQDGTVGGVGFREGSIRMIVPLSDAQSGDRRVNALGAGATWEEAMMRSRAVDARVVSILPASTESSSVRIQRVAWAQASRATVPACTWDGRRPFGCGEGQCCTGEGLAGVEPVGGACPLVYDGAASAISIAVAAADAMRNLREQLRWDLTVVARGDAATWADASFDTSCFLAEVEAVVSSVPADPCGGQPGTAPRRFDADVAENVRAGDEVAFVVRLANRCVSPVSGPSTYDLTLQLATPDGRVFGSYPTRLVVPQAPDLGGRCGDGVLNGAEECDDGNRVDTDTCTNACRIPSCGDGVVGVLQAGEVVSRASLAARTGSTFCDDGASCVGASCVVAIDPFAPEHGLCVELGYVRAVRTQWGGTAAATGTLRTMLRWSCVDGSCVDWPDPGSALSCGPGELLSLVECVGRIEQCDDGAANANAPDRCRTTCVLPACGDAIVDTGEACDRGAANDGVLCRLDCTVPRCGDGIRDRARDEECDDGRNDDGDGCSRTCTREPGFGGHVVDIGHDLYQRSAVAERILGNAVSLAGGGELAILGYTALADTDGEVPNTDAALNEQGLLLGFTPMITHVATTDALRARLAASDVVLFYEQELASGDQSAAVGVELAADLQDFVDRGGVVITMNFTGATYNILASSGLLDVTAGAFVSEGSTLTLLDVSDPVAAGIPSSYAAPNGTNTRVLAPGAPGTVVVGNAAGQDVVIHREF